MTVKPSAYDVWRQVPASLDQGARGYLFRVFGSIHERLNAIDQRGGGAVIPDRSITTTMIALLAVTTAELADLAVTTAKIAAGAVTLAKLVDGILSADAAGRAKMADGFLTVAKVAAGTFTADAPGRAPFAAAWVNTALVGDDQITKAKLAGGFLLARSISGGAPGPLTVTGIATGDDLSLVLDLTTGTDLTGEFTITGANTIDNTLGTNTTGDTLLVLALDLT